MADSMFEFDTSRERQQVQAFDQSLDKLITTVGKLDKTSLAQLRQQFKELEKSDRETVRGMSTTMNKAMDDLDAIEKESRKKFKSFADMGPLQGMIAAIKADAPNLKATLANVMKELDELGRTHMLASAQHMQAEAQRLARATGVPFSSLTSKLTAGSDMNMPSNAVLYAGRAKQDAEAYARAQIEAMSKAQAMVKAATINAGGDYANANTGRLFRIRNAELMMDHPRKEDFQAAAAATAENARLAITQAKAMVKAATMQAGGDYQSLGSGRLFRIRNAELMMDYPRKEDFQAAAANAAAEAAEAKRRLSSASVMSRYQVPQAMSMPDGVYSSLSSMKTVKPGEVDALSASFRRLASDGNDVHSMARGLASGFGAMWLTWGNLVPLFIGAGVSHAFMETAKTGMEVAHSFAIIKELGGNTREEIRALNDEMDRMGYNGTFGPKAVSEAMKTLSLAGLKANEILAVTQDTLNFSIAGTTDLKTAADTLISVSTAFGMGAAGFGRVSDVISKAAAESKTSVESFAKAMKVASVINAQYGVSLEDTAVGIAAMSQLGIENSAAGTAMRNMYSDLSGRTKQVAAILKKFNIDARDEVTGGFKPMIEVVGMLDKELGKLDGKSQKNLLAAILSERGGKGMIELLQMIQREAGGVGKAGDKLQSQLAELYKTIENSYGFSAISAAKLSQTAKSQFDSVGATLSTSLNMAYRNIEPSLLLIADGLRNALASPEFVNGISLLAESVARLGLVFATHAGTIATVGLALGGLKVAQMLLVGSATALTAITEISSAAKLRQAAASEAAAFATMAEARANGVAAGTAAAGSAARLGMIGTLGGLARLLPVIGTGVTIAAAAWTAYEFWNSKSNDTMAKSESIYANNVAKTLTDQADKLRQINDLRATGIALAEAQATVDARTKLASSQPVTTAEADAKSAAKAAADYQAALNNPSAFSRTKEMRESRLKELKDAASETYYKSVNSGMAAEQQAAQMKAAEEKIRVESKRSADITAKEIEARNAQIKRGVGTFSLDDMKKQTGGSGIGGVNDNSLKQLSQQANDRYTTLNKEYEAEKKLLEAQHSALIISEGTYQARSVAQVIAYEDKVKEVRMADWAKLKEAKDKMEESLTVDLGKAKATGKPAAVKNAQQKIENLNNEWETLSLREEEKIRQANIETSSRIAMATIKAQGEVAKAKSAMRDYALETQRERDKNAEKDALDNKYWNTNGSAFYTDMATKQGDYAAAEATAKHAANIDKTTVAYNKAREAYEALQKQEGDGTEFMNFEWLRSLANAKQVMDAQETLLGQAKQISQESADKEKQRAFGLSRDASRQELAKGFGDALYEGVRTSGKSASKMLRETLEKELLEKPFKMLINTVFDGALKNMIPGYGDMAQSIGKSLLGALTGSMGAGINGNDGTYVTAAEQVGRDDAYSNYFDVGTPYVGYDQKAMIHKGERVMTAAENAAYSAGNSGGNTMVYSPSTSVHLDSRADLAYAQQALKQQLDARDKAQREEFRRAGWVKT